ncbi:MAG TPA: ABC transporter ATP-binding protein [Bryobacterales bacterium]|nr:ABC transporter ATP-binding protein [Bryobacterales bacterium]
MTALSFDSVSKSYALYDKPIDRFKELASFQRWNYHEDFWALRDVSFEARRGTILCLIGENGSGKSTALQLAAGVFAPTHGKVYAAGRVGALLELGAGFNPEFSGRDNVYLSATLMGMSSREIARCYGDIEHFAEIGDFISRPVKTYSSGMLIRLAFAVAIHTDPEILLVDEALAVGDYYFRQRCLRKIHEMRNRQVTIVLVSHSMADIKAIGEHAVWLEDGRVKASGYADDVVAQYLARMAQKDATYSDVMSRSRANGQGGGAMAPEVVEGLPNIDGRRGNGAAEIIGIAALDEEGQPALLMEAERALLLRVSFRAREPLARPNVAVTMRNHIGLDFAVFSAAGNRVELPRMTPEDVCTVDFHLEVPELYPGNFSFSPSVTEGSGAAVQVCDWVDNALTLQMTHSGKPIYGYLRVPCHVAVNERLTPAAPTASPQS